MRATMTVFAALAALLLAGTAAEAGNWKRESTVTTPGGAKWTTKGSGSCTDGKCSWSSTTKGPGGQTITRNVTRTP